VRVLPLPPRQLGKASEEQIVAKRPLTRRNHRVERLLELLDREVDASRVSRMRKEAAGRDVDGIDAGFLEPRADLHGFVDGVARGPTVERLDGVVSLLDADLHLQVKRRADPIANRADDLEDEPRAIAQDAAVVVLSGR
jgi:hypothetical protein